MIVVDASVVAELVLRLPRAEAAAARVLDDAEDLHAPHLIDLEVASVLRRSVAAGDVSAAQAAAALELHRSLPITRYGYDALFARVWELRANLTPYDAAYVALAEALGAPLVTFDAHVARAAGHAARVESLGD